MKSRLQESWEKFQEECNDALVKYSNAHAEYLKTCEESSVKYQKIRDDFYLQYATDKV